MTRPNDGTPAWAKLANASKRLARTGERATLTPSLPDLPVWNVVACTLATLTGLPCPGLTYASKVAAASANDARMLVVMALRRMGMMVPYGAIIHAARDRLQLQAGNEAR